MEHRRRRGAAERARRRLANAAAASRGEKETDSLLARLDAWDLDADIADLSAKIEAGREDLRRLRDSLRTWRALRSRLRGERDTADAELAELIAQGSCEALLERASWFAEDGDFEAALADYGSAAKRSPKDGSIYLARGLLYYLRLKDRERALADLERAAHLRSKDAAPYVWMAHVMASRNDEEGAIRAYGRALSRAPRRADLYLERGRLWWLKGAITEALADLTRSIELDPSKPSPFQLRAICHERRGDLPSAIADLSRAIALNPKEAAFFRGRGAAHLKMKAYESAVADFASVLELRDGEDARAFLGRGAAYLGLGDDKSAADDYRRAFFYNPRFLSDLELSIRVNRKLDKPIELRADLNVLIVVEPGDVSSRLERALLSAREGDFDAAFADLDYALEILPQWDTGFFERARLYAKLGRLDRAVEDISKAIELAPHLPKHYAWRAVYRARREGDSPGARADIQRAVEIAQYDPLVRACRATYFTMIGEPGETIADFDMLILLDQTEARHYSHRAAARLRASADAASTRSALADLDLAIALDDGRAAVFRARAAARAALGDAEGAMADQARAAELLQDGEDGGRLQHDWEELLSHEEYAC